MSVLDSTNVNDEIRSQQMTPDQAFETISIWKTRLQALEGLPHAIESTAALAQVFWRDSQQRRRRQQLLGAATPSSSTIYGVGVSVMELRLAYSSAIVRCVNGFADTLQQQRFVAASVASLCQQLGIPTWIVDVRHDASHNALPTLDVLRLAASTMLEFIQSEYWIPSCPDWDGTANHNDDSRAIVTPTGDGNVIHDADGNNPRSGIDVLLDYKACASSWSVSSNGIGNGASIEPVQSTKKPSATTNSRKDKSTTSIPQTRILSYDPLFGEYKDATSSDDDDNGAPSDDDDDWEDPILGSIWGSSIGTNSNRFAIFQQPKKKKKKEEEQPAEEVKPVKKRKRKSEKTPVDYAKIFVHSVSLQDGYDVALRFLVWGGIGSAPSGRGVLIPGSEKAFPASQQGIEKCWGRYSPLVYVICRTWPGFSSALLVHLVDFVLSIENAVAEQGSLDAGSARKLYFLSSWVRLILSQRFVGALDQTFSVKNPFAQKKKTSNKSTELVWAQYEHLEILGYPLNSIVDRCCQHHGNTIPTDMFRKTSRAIRHIIEEILGQEQRVQNYGYSYEQDGTMSLRNDITEFDSSEKGATHCDCPSQPASFVATPGTISLDEMEAFLEDDDASMRTKRPIEDSTMVHTGTTNDDGTQSLRPAWIMCQRWDPCAIGTLPGYPV